MIIETFLDGKLQTRNMNYYYYKNVSLPKVISTTFTNDSDTISFDLTSVYPVPSLLSLIRTNVYQRKSANQSVTIQDYVKFSSLTSFSFGIPSRNGVWTTISASNNTLVGKFTVSSNTVNVRINTSNPFTYKVVTKTRNSVTFTRLGIYMTSPILKDTIKVTYC